jgi:endonuclease-3
MNSSIAIKQLKELKKLVSVHEEKPRLAAEGWNQEWQTLIAIMLSAQTRDTKTIEVSNELFKKYKNPEKLGKANIKEIENQIRSINYYKTKAKHIKETAQILSKIKMPETIEELIKLPGVGRKTANVFLVEARNAPAIGVDTHLSFVSQYLKWSKNKNPYKIELDLQKLFPKSYWNKINYIVVSFGQLYSRTKQKEILDKIK